jgi:hypothetical protein
MAPGDERHSTLQRHWPPRMDRPEDVARASRQRPSGKRQRVANVPPDMIHISVGLAHFDDILWDIDQALAAAGG